MSQVVRWVFFICVVGSLAGCEFLPSRNLSTLPPLKPKVELKVSWTERLGWLPVQDALALKPLWVDKRVYVAHPNGRLTALDPVLGDELWSVKNLGAFSAGPVLSNDVLYLGTNEGEVYAVSKEKGKVLWKRDVGSEILAPPTVSLSWLIVQTIDGQVVALSADTGEVRWRYARSIPLLSLRGSSTPVVYEDVVLAGLANGHLVALSLLDGKLLWERTLGEPEGGSDLARIVDIDATPVVADGVVYAMAYQGHLLAIDIETGQVRWETTLSGSADLSLLEDMLLVVDAKQHVLALNRRTGGVMWDQGLLAGRTLTAPLAAGGILFVGDEAGFLHGFSLRTGEPLARLRVEYQGLLSLAKVGEREILVYGRSGKLSAVYVK